MVDDPEKLEDGLTPVSLGRQARVPNRQILDLDGHRDLPPCVPVKSLELEDEDIRGART